MSNCDIHISYIIHPVPINELENFVVYPRPRIDIAHNGKPVTFTMKCNGGEMMRSGKLWMEVISWVPFDRWAVNKIE